MDLIYLAQSTINHCLTYFTLNQSPQLLPKSRGNCSLEITCLTFRNLHLLSVHYRVWISDTFHLSEWLFMQSTQCAISASQHLPMAYLAKSGPDIYAISEVIILNNDQRQHQKTISTNDRINSKINQHLTHFVNLCYCGREVLFEKVCLLFASLSYMENYFLPNR